MTTSKTIIIHVQYDPNVTQISNDVGLAADAAVEVLEELHFKEVIEKRLQSKLTPNQFKLIRVQVK
jgi:hypothetical protein